MTKKIKLGDYNRLRIVKKVDFGLYLDGGNEGEILLPSRYVPEDAGIGDELYVFIYLDQVKRNLLPTRFIVCSILRDNHVAADHDRIRVQTANCAKKRTVWPVRIVFLPIDLTVQTWPRNT